jgi:hypothetical protein
VQLGDGVLGYAAEHVAQVGERVDLVALAGGHEAGQDRGGPAAAIAVEKHPETRTCLMPTSDWSARRPSRAAVRSRRSIRLPTMARPRASIWAGLCASISANQTFDAIVTKDQPTTVVRPCIWPTAVLMEDNDQAFNIKVMASPDSGSGLTMVVQMRLRLWAWLTACAEYERCRGPIPVSATHPVPGQH